MDKIKAIIISICLVSCQYMPKANRYNDLHEKYRTLWYRTGSSCFYDSSKKYGELYRKEMGWEPVNINTVDTVPVKENIICK